MKDWREAEPGILSCGPWESAPRVENQFDETAKLLRRHLPSGFVSVDTVIEAWVAGRIVSSDE